MGNRYKSGGAIIVPAFTDHVAKQLQAESQKDRRKLAEAKGVGRGRGAPPPKAVPKGGQPAASGSGA